MPSPRIALAAFTMFGASSSALIAAGATIAESSPASDAEAMTLGIKSVLALVGFAIVSTFAVAGVYFGLLFALRTERRERKTMERRIARLEGAQWPDESPKRDALGNAMDWQNET